MSHDVPPEILEKGPVAVREFLLQQNFEASDAVFEGTVLSVTRLSGDDWPRTRTRVRVGKVWKSDGGSLEIIVSGLGGGDCGADFSVGTTFVIFAARVDSIWSFLPWVEEPLAAGVADVVATTPLTQYEDDMVAWHKKFFLDPLSRVLKAPDLAMPPSNNALERP